MRISLALSMLMLLCLSCRKKEERTLKHEPAEWFLMQRSYPDFSFNTKAFENELRAVALSSMQKSSQSLGWNTPWLQEGPANTGGRFNCIAVDPTDADIIYAGSASGGIFKTTDGGLTWFPVFDDQPWLAVSTIVFEPGNPDVLYAGTGDKNISITPFIGDGIYKSIDAGATWTHLGLTDQRIISRIVVDPLNTDNIYAAAMGLPFVRNNDRGIYKSSDGGLTWTQSLFVNDSTGGIDLLIDPQNPQILYAATWNRIRNNHETIVDGPDAAIYKTNDGGLTWNKLTSGLPSGNMSRIGLAMSGTNSNILWAVYVNPGLDMEGIFKTVNGGATWTQVPDPGAIFGGFGWYFGRIEVNPVNNNELWVCGVDLWKTTDGGNTWNGAWTTSNPHADKHDIVYISNNTWLLATDGGMYKTTDGGVSWNDIEMIANNQFYRITYDPLNPGVYAGGVQDNGTNEGNASVINNWQMLFGADGFQMRYHPSDPLTRYVEIQNGGIFVTTDGGFNYMDATNGIDPFDRRGWDMPYILNPDNPDQLYTGTYRIYVNNSGANANWLPVSPDLTDGVIFGERFHTVTAVAQSAVDNDMLMAGTSDGNVWNSLNGGNSWNNITSGLPDRYVTSVYFSPNTANTAYATHSGYKDNDFIPHIHKTINNGAIWTDISGNLPQLAINDMQTYPGTDSILFVATDAGVYGTTDAGTTWTRVGNNMPAIAVFDLDLDPFNNKLLAGTFARSMWSFPVDSILTGVKNIDASATLHIYPNPVHEKLYIQGIHSEADVMIYNLQGRLIIMEHSADPSAGIDVSALPSGTYVLNMQVQSGDITKKFIKLK